MPLFLLIPVWLMTLVGTVVFLFFRPVRYLATYMILVSSAGMVSAVVLFLFVIIAAPFAPQSGIANKLCTILAFVGVPGGVILSVYLAVRLSAELNKRVPWLRRP